MPVATAINSPVLGAATRAAVVGAVQSRGVVAAQGRGVLAVVHTIQRPIVHGALAVSEGFGRQEVFDGLPAETPQYPAIASQTITIAGEEVCELYLCAEDA